MTKLLLQAAQWFEHPHMSRDLAHHYLSTGDVSLAVQHHLTYCLWQFSTLKTYRPLPPESDDVDESRSSQWYKRQWEFRSSTAEFTIDDGTEEEDEEVAHLLEREQISRCVADDRAGVAASSIE